jgi:hypothetical protein
MIIPVAGPVLAAWRTPANARSGGIWPYAVWSGVEALGAAMLVAGSLGHDVLEWRPRDSAARASIVPTLTRGLGALSLNVSW